MGYQAVTVVATLASCGGNMHHGVIKKKSQVVGWGVGTACLTVQQQVDQRGNSKKKKKKVHVLSKLINKRFDWNKMLRKKEGRAEKKEQGSRVKK